MVSKLLKVLFGAGVGFSASWAFFRFAVFPWAMPGGEGISSLGFQAFIVNLIVAAVVGFLAWRHL